MKIVLIISSLKAGGAERVLSHLANYWASKGWDITLITTWPVQKDFYGLHPRIKRFSLDQGGESASILGSIKRNWEKLKKLRSSIKAENPAIIISFLPDSSVLSVISSAFLGKKIVVSERNNAAHQTLSPFWRMLRRLTYTFADAAVFVSHGVEKDFLWLPQDRRFVINNPVLQPPSPGNGSATSRNLQILSVGRLTHQKGHDILIESFSKIAPSHPDWNILIVGEGPDREKLERQVKNSGLDNRIKYYGTHRNPKELMNESSLFVLSSRYEGFPNVLVEAMSAGMPVISFDCPYGPSDIIHHDVNGILVSPENTTELADAINDLIEDPARRERLAHAAKDVSTRFSIETIARQWETLFEKI